MRCPRSRWPVVIGASAFALALVLLAESGLPLRPIVVIWFLAVCPGMAFVPLLAIRDWLTALTIGVGVSLALDALVAEAMVYTGYWSATWSLAALVAIACAGAAWQVMRAARVAGINERQSHDTSPQVVHRDDSYVYEYQAAGDGDGWCAGPRSYMDVSRLPKPASSSALVYERGEGPRPQGRQSARAVR
ncbi:MAG: hypothetical protein LC793_17500 [Thermomicrobia bacterium]|nr:hypothetical protein [Thermomicrobia bacterium]